VQLDVDAAAREAASLEPKLVLSGAVPRLIDEWQLVPEVWNSIRREVDSRKRPGQFILTGSAVPADDVTRHSGAMRFSRLRLRPMTLSEAGASSSAVSLKAVLAGEPISAQDSGLEIRDLLDEVVRGGWPTNRALPLADAGQSVRDYLDQISRTDIQLVDGVQRDPQRVSAVLRSLARSIATPVSLTTIAADTAGSGSPVNYETVGNYLDALERLFVVENSPAWNVHMRSSHQLRKAATRYFTDPSRSRP